MKKYIGTKTILARPMSKWEAYEENLLKAGVIATQEDKNTQGYEILYEDGYHSWSPKETFDKAYRLAESPVDRMRIELDDLSEKFTKLGIFLGTPKFLSLDKGMCDLLHRQFKAMKEYKEILEKRLGLMQKQ